MQWIEGIVLPNKVGCLRQRRTLTHGGVAGGFDAAAGGRPGRRVKDRPEGFTKRWNWTVFTKSSITSRQQNMLRLKATFIFKGFFSSMALLVSGTKSVQRSGDTKKYPPPTLDLLLPVTPLDLLLVDAASRTQPSHDGKGQVDHWFRDQLRS